MSDAAPPTPGYLYRLCLVYTRHMTSGPFARLQKNTTVASINAILVPWLIADFGMHYADADNVETATHMLTHIIISQQLGGYTASTFTAAIDGQRVEQVAYTKLTLKTAG